MNSLGMTQAPENTIDWFDKWYSEKGIRCYSNNHGTADGHKDYMRIAFISGWLYCSLFRKDDLPEYNQQG